MTGRAAAAESVAACAVRKTFRRDAGAVVDALADVSLTIPRGALAALVGPDGAGKTTLLRLIAGLCSPDAGGLRVLDVDVARDPQEVQSRVGYMPQRFGLYEDLSVQENLDLYADLHGVVGAARAERYARLLSMTALAPFTKRLAGRLSGGMKQKLGLACTLVRAPELLLLDEPTAGVDPLSRRELWEIVGDLVRRQGITVLLATSYLDEAERCDRVLVLREGRALAQGRPAEVTALARGRTFRASPPEGETARALQARLLARADVVDAVPEGGAVRIVVGDGRDGAPVAAVDVEPRFEDGFMVLVRGDAGTRGESPATTIERRAAAGDGRPAVEVRGLVRRFGEFVAVDRVSFDVRAGEVFGLLGPNGAGKTTVFRMLCGLLPATDGTLRVAGVDVRGARASARRKIGYVAQRFSLYRQLSVAENLGFFAGAYGLHGRRGRERIAWALEQFDLAPFARTAAGRLPGGHKQRLAMAAALLHEPDLLFLDEPTSGADPLARREFWRRITTLADRGVTVIVTTHFLEEAEYCDRVAILDAGRVLAEGTPAEIRSRALPAPGRAPDMEDAFVAIVEESRAAERARGAGAA